MLEFPCVRDPRTGEQAWALDRQRLRGWEEVFPDMDVLGELRKAREWLAVKRERRKTARGMPWFLFSWLSRGQDGGRYLRRAAPAPGPGPAAGVEPGAAALFQEYGFASWEEWEAKLRANFTGDELAAALARLRELRRRWVDPEERPGA